MQTTFGLTLDNVIPKGGQLLCEPILGRYTTESGLEVVDGNALRRNPKVSKLKVIKTGGAWTAIEFYKESKKIVKSWPGRYYAKPGDIIWHFRASEVKQDIQGKTHAFVYNENIRAVFDGEKLIAPSTYVIIEPVYEDTAHGSFLFVQERDQKTTANFYGIVISVGAESKHRWDLKPGDKVLFKRTYGVGAEGTAFEHNGKEYIAMADRWLEALIHGDDNTE